MKIVPCYFLFHDGDCFHGSCKVDAELDYFHHIWASIEIADGRLGKSTVGVNYFQVVMSQKNSRQNVHLFHNHLRLNINVN